MLARWPDFLELTKPRVVALMLITAVIGMCMAVRFCTGSRWFWAILALPFVQVQPRQSTMWSTSVLIKDVPHHEPPRRTRACQPVGSDCLCNTTGDSWYRAACYHGECADRCFDGGELGRLCLHLHHVFETCDATNIVIGGLAGAAPPLLGWTAVTGEIHAHGLLLVLIIFAWTPPHFWALAIHRKGSTQPLEFPCCRSSR